MRFPECTCRHLAADHQSAGTGWPHPVRYGVCLIDGCECREFVNADRLNDPDDPERGVSASLKRQDEFYRRVRGPR